MSLQTAEAIANQLRMKPDSCLALPTGRTPIGCYQILSEWSRLGQLDWSKAKCFALDDYLDVEESQSFAYYLTKHLYCSTNLPKIARFNPRFCDNYDLLIAHQGGLDLAIVGIGRNGHIAFNEPGTPKESWTHCLFLTESTRKANASPFGSIASVPKRAITIGIRTILDSARVILVANGKDKKAILTKALSGTITTDVPASFLQSHLHLDLITDFDYEKS